MYNYFCTEKKWFDTFTLLMPKNIFSWSKHIMLLSIITFFPPHLLLFVHWIHPCINFSIIVAFQNTQVYKTIKEMKTVLIQLCGVVNEHIGFGISLMCSAGQHNLYRLNGSSGRKKTFASVLTFGTCAHKGHQFS